MFYLSLTIASFLVSAIPIAASFNLDENMIKLSLRGMELAAAVRTHEPNAVAGSNFYIDEPDAALVVREGNYCFMVFDSTKPTSEDWWQNLDTSFDEICSSSSGDCCQARAGFVRAYTSPSYKDTLEADLRLCMKNCTQCEAVLVGHSQGGAIGAVAAVAMEDVNPTLITFGQPASIDGSCPPIDADKYYRFENTVEDGDGTLDYDPVPYLNLADQMGKLFIMGNDDQNVVYYGDGNGPNPVLFGYQNSAHRDDYYVKRLQQFQGKGEIGTSGWRVGFACNVNEECINKSCVDGRCGHRGADGDPCNRDNDCDSGRCEGFSSGKCEPKLNVDAGCNENSDCTTNKCNWRFKCSS